MKRYFVALAFAISLGLLPSNAVPQHRHHPSVTALADTAKTGIEAYSDTSSVASAPADTVVNLGPVADKEDNSDANPIIFFLRNLVGGTASVGAVLLALVVVFFVFLFLLSPFIIAALVIRYAIKRHNDKVDIAKQAMATGVPIPSGASVDGMKPGGEMWKKGVRNVAIGVGLALLFYFLGAKELIGVGCLIACMGGGQIYIAKKAMAQSKDRTEDTQKPEF